jgi:nitroreductase
MTEVREALRTTGTCRYYTDEPVPDGLLAQALDAARFAPQGGNLQPVRWVVVRDRARLATLAGWYLEEREAEVRELLAIPDGTATACHVAVGRPARPWPTRLNRRPVRETAFADVYGQPFEEHTR